MDFLNCRRLYKTIYLDKGVMRQPNPDSKLPSWMQRGVFLRDMPNEKFFENSPTLPNTDEISSARKLSNRKNLQKQNENLGSAEKYLGLLYLDYNKVTSSK